ncbi:hypothetical protein [Thermoproteus tenax]|uniref:Uncharacterized protein n=1 Tax=Thermoproteus tenax (strain ATCC 35583 / DSM 2078 / JCM 9277 / NBRC 100435 / Kra 1) TaxID=768679 RepID=G4RQ77_THETK|nr:hypothetical protein [Thermoproteus tenax]CCC80714.1 hypothetical protein TTX_0035 [Thermoproteus tenax Kra 1]
MSEDKALEELGRSLGQLLRSYLEIKEALLKPITEPIERELKEALGEVLYRWLTDLGQARELRRDVDVKTLYQEILRRHVGDLQQ